MSPVSPSNKLHCLSVMSFMLNEFAICFRPFIPGAGVNFEESRKYIIMLWCFVFLSNCLSKSFNDVVCQKIEKKRIFGYLCNKVKLTIYMVV